MLRCCGSRLVDLADLLACFETYVDLPDIFEYYALYCGYLAEMLGLISRHHCLCGSKYGDPVTP